MQAGERWSDGAMPAKVAEVRGEAWRAMLGEHPSGARDWAGRGRYTLALVDGGGVVQYVTHELYLHDWHDIIASAAGWASALLDTGSGYAADAEPATDAERADLAALERLRELPGVGMEADAFAMVEVEREGH